MRILISIILGLLITSGAYAAGPGTACTDETALEEQINNLRIRAATNTLTPTDALIMHMEKLWPNNCDGDNLVCKKGICQIGKCSKDIYIPNGGECCYGYKSNSDGFCKKCTGCGNCTSSDQWLPMLLDRNSAGVEARNQALCLCDSCENILIKRCMAGYYQSGTRNGSIVCTKCPIDELTGKQSTSNAGAQSISDCYIPGGKDGDDDSGKYKFNTDCYYVP